MKKYIPVTSLLIVFIILGCNSPKDSTPQSGMNSFREDLFTPGNYKGKDFNILEEAWKFETGIAIRSTPVFSDGQIYFGSGDSTFYSLNATTGKEAWHFTADAAIHSSPGISNDNVYFMDRMNNLFALKKSNGEIVWKVKLGESLRYDWGFDYYMSSPLINDNTVFIGSGDGNLYAIDATSGKNKWQYNASSIIRSSPSFSNGLIYFGDYAGRFYAVDEKTGEKKWEFKTIGDTLKNEEYGFDRKAILAKPAIKDSIVVFGSRDGYLYAINANTGTQLWNYNYEISWIISSVAIKDSFVVTGTSDGKFINAINLYTGKQIWRSTTGVIWSSPVIINNTVVTPGTDGFIYLHDLMTGKEKNRIRVGDRFFSSPIFNDNMIYAGNDNGNLYTFKTINDDKRTTTVHKAVYWIKDPIYQSFKNGTDLYTRDYFMAEDYETLDENKIVEFLQSRITDTEASVIIFATNLFPEAIIKKDVKGSLLLQYLNKGGKIVILGPNPAIFNIDYAKKQFLGYDFSFSESATGLDYPYKDLRSHKGFYPSGITSEGQKWGLTKTPMIGIGVHAKNVLPLAIDETGNATYWVKNYGHKYGTGFVQLWLSASNTDFIKEVKKIAEYGLY